MAGLGVVEDGDPQERAVAQGNIEVGSSIQPTAHFEPPATRGPGGAPGHVGPVAGPGLGQDHARQHRTHREVIKLRDVRRPSPKYIAQSPSSLTPASSDASDSTAKSAGSSGTRRGTTRSAVGASQLTSQISQLTGWSLS